MPGDDGRWVRDTQGPMPRSCPKKVGASRHEQPRGKILQTRPYVPSHSPRKAVLLPLGFVLHCASRSNRRVGTSHVAVDQRERGHVICRHGHLSVLALPTSDSRFLAGNGRHKASLERSVLQQTSPNGCCVPANPYRKSRITCLISPNLH
jgi:hypothetical protein